MKIQNNGITEQRAAFLARDYSRGFIQYCQIEPEVVGKGYFQSKVKIETHHRQQDGFFMQALWRPWQIIPPGIQPLR